MKSSGKRRTWPLAVIGLGVLTAGAWFVSRPSLEQQLAQQAAAVAAGQGAELQVQVRGRDVRLQGVVPSSRLGERLVQRVHAIRGVRRVEAGGLKVALAAPTVEPVRGAKPPLVLQGTWPAAEGVVLSVRIGTRTWTAGRDDALRVQDGRWRLQLDELPPPGTYNVVVTARDGETSVMDGSSGELLVEAPPRPAPPPPPPTVRPLLSARERPEITGTIALPGRVRQLKVELAGRVYVEGDGHLTRQGAVWRLVPAEPLPEGTHDVKVIAIGESGAATTDATRNELVIDRTPPARPQVDELIVVGNQAVMRGSWPEGDAKLLRIIVDGEKYDIDEDGSPLVRDGDGRFKLMLPAARLPAMRNATLLTVDAAGNVAEGEKPAAVGNACQQKVNDVLIQDMIHFTTGSAEISHDSLLLLDRLAEVLKGCPDMQVVIVGHTDNVGDLMANQKLSEERARAVKQALVERGLDADTIIARGEGETHPLVPNDSDRNRQINRRIEITVRPRQP